MENAEEQEPKRRSPAEAFDELKAAVNRSTAEISDLWDFSRKVKDKLLQAAEIHRMEGMLPVLDSMLQIHQIVFARVTSTAKTNGKEAEKGNGDQFIGNLLETLEEELSRHGIEVVKPASGVAFDVHTMDCTTAVKGSKKDEANTVAAVNRCGFLYKSPAEKAPRILAKAQVEVFAK